ncbi:MAG: Phenylacetic acid degradation-related protein [Desulfotomaculum sp. 46_296]|nr:MAG: Phenylacetic acid degradation-related protein [Desulfotomaculum sp. 46_296]HAU31664.1 thioesterase [Desulfotomaculum sp.]
MEDRRNNLCIACSSSNPNGFHVEFKLQDNVCRAYFTAGENHQGRNGLMHGGLISTLLDEAMGQLLWSQNKIAVTAEMKISFSLPVSIGEKLLIEARETDSSRRLCKLSAAITLPDEKQAVTAEGKFLPAKLQ